MILYILKSILCLAILLLVYLLFLEKEKMHRFNRWYLLGSIVFACIVPVISFEMQPESLSVLRNNYFEIIYSNNIVSPAQRSAQGVVVNNTDYVLPVLLSIYALVTSFLLVRFFRNIYLLLSSAAKNKVVRYQGANLVLLKEKVASYSFLNNIFISETDYLEQKLEGELITHELTHVKEKHSWDVIFIELLQVFCWFNPMFIFYKKAIQLNHEYLADDAVIKSYRNVPAYQYLLLDKASCTCNTNLTSNFNYSVTKKRLVMMTRTTNGTTALIKKLSVLPVLAATVFIFSSKIVAQDPPKVTLKSLEVSSTKEGVSQQLVDELNAIVQRNITQTKNGHPILPVVGEADRNRLETIYLQMSKAQQAQSKVVFQKRLSHKLSGAPSDALYESFKDPAKFGVWINGKKVKNDALDKYKASDFGDYWSSNLNYTAKMKEDVMKRFNLTTMYEKQLELTTREVAEEQNKLALAEAKKHPNMMLFRYDKRTMGFVD